MRLLDESYQLGPEGGGVDYLAARYVIGARLRAIHGDWDSAVERLSAGMRVAEQLGLQRLAAGVNNERIRLGIDIAPAVADRLRAERTIPRNDGIARMTAELDEDSGIRLLCASDSDEDHQQACLRARDLLAGTDGEHRPLAALTSRLLLTETLTATGRLEDAAVASSDAAARCAAVGLSRLPVDAGLR
jgi:serine/threonine-protein kinase PknK